MTVRLLHQIGDRANGSNFNTLEEILACDEPMHFDGVYQSVWENRDALKGKGKDFTLFVTGAYLGKTNAFDLGQPLSKFCTLRQVEELAELLNAKIGWHGKMHRRCKGLDPISVYDEIKPPDWWVNAHRATMSLAWPYGDFDDVAIEVADRLGYTEAWSVTQGGVSLPFAKYRTHLNW